MRVPIRIQLGLLVLLTSLVALAVIAIATWTTSYSFLLGVTSSRLSLTASLKASQIASAFQLMQSTVRSASTRILFQEALQAYNNGNNTSQNWETPGADLQSAFGGTGGQLVSLQGIVFPRDNLGGGDVHGLLNVTSTAVLGAIALPYTYPNGSVVYLGDAGIGFPPALYPNFTYTTEVVGNLSQTTAYYSAQPFFMNTSLLLGPLQINDTYALLSLTRAIVNNTNPVEILGWLTVVMDATIIFNIVDSPEGLEETGSVLLVGPDTSNNRFPPGIFYNDTQGHGSPSVIDATRVHFVLWPLLGYKSDRLPEYANSTANYSFPITSYPAILVGLTQNQSTINNAGTLLSTHNQRGKSVSVGFAIPSTHLCDWILLLEQDESEAWNPVNQMRRVLLGCTFGTVGGIWLFTIPIAYFSSLPISRLRNSTTRAIAASREDQNKSTDTDEKNSDNSEPEIKAETNGGPLNASPHRKLRGRKAAEHQESSVGSSDSHLELPRVNTSKGSSGLPAVYSWLIGKCRRKSSKQGSQIDEETGPRASHIPGKVKDGKHFIHDELTDLTQTFNEMSEELYLQYSRLEERVKQRTSELEVSKVAAEAANKSKTLFIANISHELKTPLNGILGMCAVCMQEDDLPTIKRSLGIIARSGDLLHNLLSDLLLFSKNQVGQQLSLNEEEFRLSDIGSQLKALFHLQAKDGEIKFKVDYEDGDSTLDYGLKARIKNMSVWGDQYRILQVVINLVSNSLKFTQAGGSVHFTIRCLNSRKVETSLRSSRNSVTSSSMRIHSNSNSRPRLSNESVNAQDTRLESSRSGTANEINPTESPKGASGTLEGQPPSNMPAQMFEFEVRDTGPGIAPELQQQIFEPFVQGSAGLTKRFGGTGLGLSICSQLAKLMRGSISLESEVGVGSKFTLRIPLQPLSSRPDSPTRVGRSSLRNSVSLSEAPSIHIDPPQERSSSTEKPKLVPISHPSTGVGSNHPAATSLLDTVVPPKRGSRTRVLVAEDNKVNQEVVLRMLRLEDVVDVSIAKDGQEALDKVKESIAEKNSYDMILMDVQMPILDGRASTRLIRELGFTAPIVALTAFADEINQKECMESGMDYFLAKPIRRPALKHVLKRYCSQINEIAEVTASNPPAPDPPPIPSAAESQAPAKGAAKATS